MLMPSIFGGRFFDDFMEPFESFQTGNNLKTDVEENDSSYMLTMDAPGMKKEDIHAQLEDGYLTITAESKTEHEKKDASGKYIRKERYSGTSSRSFYVGENVTQEDIKAKFENGTLKLLIPKKEEKKPIEEKHLIQIEG